MLAAAVALFFAAAAADPADNAPSTPVAGVAPAAPANDAAPNVAPNVAPANVLSAARIRIKIVNGAMASPSVRLWPKDDVIVSADDSSGDDNEYEWTLVSRPPSSTARVDKPNAVDTGFAYEEHGRLYGGLDEAGEYRVHLKLTSTATGNVSERDFVLHVGWPASTNAFAPSSPSSSSSSSPSPPSSSKQASADARNSMTMSSLAGCAVGTCVPCGIGAIGSLAPGVNGVAFACGVSACGPCATLGALVGAGYGANDAHIDWFDLSPLLLTGVGAEVVGGSLLATSALFTGSLGFLGLPSTFNPTTGTSTVLGVTPNQSLVALGIITGGVLVVAGGPVTVLSAWASAPTENDPLPTSTSLGALARGDPR